MTSLSMPGFSLTLLLLPRQGDKEVYSAEKLLSLLDAPASAPGWKYYAAAPPGAVSGEKEQAVEHKSVKEVDLARKSEWLRTVEYRHTDTSATDTNEFLAAITRACKALIEAEPELTKQDQIAGDGDAGLTLEAGAKGVLKAIKEGKIQGKNIIEDIGVIAEVVEDDMGGTSGALYSCVRYPGKKEAADVQDLLCWSWTITP